MNRTTKLLLGLVSLFPLLYLLNFIAALFTKTLPFSLMIKYHLAVAGLIVFLLVVFITHVFKNKALDDSRKIMWLIILFFGYPIAMPVYWYHNIWKSESV